ncbi:hypothetical protein ITP53_11390 [Nonomuraea sp. K274]|uniref:Uncharacterized protein n=1 Tax=Nonomuraea cypriaca TaxID=1187855 RepID=A0A931A4X3_9ACTN|nr:hypothetical protein [Nonomuraea cypriaca]MBF8186342.1 hypothetical protein [Nonomuraea cypriaca]
MSYTPNVVLPELSGLTLVGQIDFYDGPTEADVTGVWRDDAIGQLYFADDCDFEGILAHDAVTREDLFPCTADVLEAYLNERLDGAEWMNAREPYVAEIAELMGRARAL